MAGTAGRLGLHCPTPTEESEPAADRCHADLEPFGDSIVCIFTILVRINNALAKFGGVRSGQRSTS